MPRIRANQNPKKKKNNIPITRIGKKQYLKRRFAHVRAVDNAGKNNPQTQKYHKHQHTAAQNYTRLGLAIDPSASKATVEQHKKVVKPHMKQKFEEPSTEHRKSLGHPVSEQEGTMLNNLMLKHGTDFKAMSMDYKLNPYQLTPTQLQKRILNYLNFEQAAFPEEYAAMAANGWLEDYSDKKLRKRQRINEKEA